MMTNLPSSGAVTGGVALTLRAEGACVFAVSLWAYANTGAGWATFALGFFAPDLSFAGYFAGPRIGALVYNAAHSYVGALGVLALGAVSGTAGAIAAGLIWCGHIGFDRMLGYGLKYPDGFGATHLGRIGRDRRTP